MCLSLSFPSQHNFSCHKLMAFELCQETKHNKQLPDHRSFHFFFFHWFLLPELFVYNTYSCIIQTPNFSQQNPGGKNSMPVPCSPRRKIFLEIFFYGLNYYTLKLTTFFLFENKNKKNSTFYKRVHFPILIQCRMITDFQKKLALEKTSN